MAFRLFARAAELVLRTLFFAESFLTRSSPANATIIERVTSASKL
jgi:hypothetical protein